MTSRHEAKTGRPAQRVAHAHRTLGFGVPATSDPHHFVVSIPRGNTTAVLISEHLGMGAGTAPEQVLDRVMLQRLRWTAIRAEVQRAFNARLKAQNLASSTWKVGDNPVDRLLGKELCVLAWAIEQLDPQKIPLAVRNWLALRPEERWWLFGMTAVASGGLQDGEHGWRVALRYALGGVAQNELMRTRRLLTSADKRPQPSLGLFDD
ncbi:MAG: DUF3780 domain-containing protein [Chromatiaceae bacterium]|nr:DUF3780 domain-containing protein [Chromatiaceae bacterium]MCF7995799.1 DUF3780 domain-containing protein [Chromatiaceae bacterium]MCF8016285.1 DUF3780 domain-containing protein [Chromatiaceae bacterium]